MGLTFAASNIFYFNNNNNIIIRQSGYVNLIDSHATLQSFHFCKLNTITWVVELIDVTTRVVIKRESLLGGHSKACCTVMSSVAILKI